MYVNMIPSALEAKICSVVLSVQWSTEGYGVIIRFVNSKIVIATIVH